MFNDEQYEALSAPLNKANVKERVQGKATLSYVEAWHVIAEANRVFGFDGWNRETLELRQLGDVRIVKNKFGDDQARVGYSARVRITVFAGDRIITREGCGFGSGIDKDQDQAHESALKEAESDAMKRAFMTFGNIFGLALYDKTQSNVEADTSARDMAVRVLNTCKDAAELRECWTKNFKGWKDVLSGPDFSLVEKAKDSLKIQFSVDPFTSEKDAA